MGGFQSFMSRMLIKYETVSESRILLSSTNQTFLLSGELGQ